MKKNSLSVSLLLLTALGLPSSLAAQNDAGEPDELLFSFTGPESFPIDNMITLLQAGDLDADGLTDLVVVNNARSRINLLFNQTGKTNSPAAREDRRKHDLNELSPDARFRIESIASEKRISALALEDLNSDGLPDLAYYGEPKELVVQYNEGNNTWSAPRRWPIEDGQLSPNTMTTGDLNGDDRPDIVLLAEKFAWYLPQQEDGTLAEPQQIPFSSTARAVQVLDVDGDGRQDLLLVDWESPTPFRFRLQKENGELGPEVYFELPSVRSYWADNLRENEDVQIMTIAAQSGRAAISHFERKGAEALTEEFREGLFEVLPLRATDKARRGVAWADLDGDARSDLVVAEPENGQVSVFFQEADGSLGSSRTFPSLAGISHIEVADWDGDGRKELFLLSADEKQVGVTRLDENRRLGFPELVPLTGRPLGLAVGSLTPTKAPVLAMLVDDGGSRSLVIRDSSGEEKITALSKRFQSNPASFAVIDVDQDGLSDFVVLIPYEKVKVLRQTSESEFEELDIAPPGGEMERPWFSAADVNGDGKPELLLNQRNFLRAVVLESDAGREDSWHFRVREQINGAASNSRLVGATAIPQSSNSRPLLFLLDIERKAISLCEPDESGVYQVTRNIRLPFYEFGALQGVALGGENINAVSCIGTRAVAWLRLEGKTWELSELDGYETPIKNGFLHDVVSGDLNSDGQKDLVFLETAKHYLDLVLFTADNRLVPGDRWRVFEERSYRGGRTSIPEPREALVADLTGDGKSDLAVLVHDRILLYPQE